MVLTAMLFIRAAYLVCQGRALQTDTRPIIPPLLQTTDDNIPGSRLFAFQTRGNAERGKGGNQQLQGVEQIDAASVVPGSNRNDRGDKRPELSRLQ